MLVWALVIGYLVWGDVPTLALLLGSGIVVACGLFLLWHEARRGRPEQSTAVVAQSIEAEVLRKGDKSQP